MEQKVRRLWTCAENLVLQRDLIHGLSSPKPDAVTGGTAQRNNKHVSKTEKITCRLNHRRQLKKQSSNGTHTDTQITLK
jgi:hypothetical protein